MWARARWVIGVPFGLSFLDWKRRLAHSNSDKNVSKPLPHREYDYVIVGAGSSGCALAARLSEDKQTTVLLLEEGDDFRSEEAPEALRSPNPIAMVMPAYYPQFQYPTLLARRSPLQSAKLYWRGRGVGGSSLINGQIAIRAAKEDFDDWQAGGCTGWGWENVLPCFKRLEHDPLAAYLPLLHGINGPVPITRAPMGHWGSVDLALLQAGLDLGHPWKVRGDCNSPGDGLAILPTNSIGAKRVTVNDGYIEPIRNRSNITIAGGALVDKVSLEGSKEKGFRAKNVRVRLNGEWQEIEAKKEIILCAGAIHTPAILLRSGVGSRADLEKLSIPCLLDLPVGKNLQEHPLLGAILRLKPAAQAKSPFERHTNLCLRFTTQYPGDAFVVSLNAFGASIGQFLPKSKPFTSMQPAYTEEDHHAHEDEGEFYLGDGERGEMEIDSHSATTGEWCYMSGRLVEGCPCCEGFDLHAEDKPAELVLPNDPRVLIGRPGLEPLGMICVWLGKVFSKGTIELASVDPVVHPKVEMNLLGDERDQSRMIQALHQLLDVCKHPALTAITESIVFDAVDTNVQGMEDMLKGSPEKVRDWMLRNVGDTQHVAGSCAMGGEKNSESVTDPSLRVKGVSNLRIADASIMPTVVRANTHLTAVMIGERAAELIKC